MCYKAPAWVGVLMCGVKMNSSFKYNRNSSNTMLLKFNISASVCDHVAYALWLQFPGVIYLAAAEQVC